jgi:hypothetical protein
VSSSEPILSDPKQVAKIVSHDVVGTQPQSTTATQPLQPTNDVRHTSSVPKPNVWTQRAQARASAASSPTASSFTANPTPATPLPPPQETPAAVSIEANITACKAPANGAAHPVVIDDNTWPEVGPSSGGSSTRANSKVRNASEKEKEGQTPKKGEYHKWTESI